MKKIVLLIMVILLALALPAEAKDAPPELSVIPANTQWVLHFDVQKFTATELYGYFKEINGGPFDRYTHKMREKLNINIMKDISWITVFGQRLHGDNAAFCCKGNFNVPHLVSLVEKEITYRNIPYSKHIIHSWGNQFGAFAGPIFVYSKNENMIKNVLDAIDGKRKHHKGPPPMAFKREMPAGTFLSIVADDIPSIMGKHGNTFILKQTRMAFFLAMEKSGFLNLKLRMTAESVEAARNIEQVVRGLIAMAKLQQGEKPHKGHGGKHAHMLKYVDDLKIALDGNTLRLELNVPSKELADVVLSRKKIF